jgi:biopolymer transport protein ExbD
MAKARPIRTHFASETREFAPIAAINMTPLIDMMLVIIIMLIICIPLTTHRVDVDLPGPTLVRTEPPPFHTLAIDAGGALAWDGQGLAAAALPGRLAAFRADPAAPVLHFAAAGEARYERVDQVLGEIRRARVTRLGFVGNEGFASSLDH